MSSAPKKAPAAKPANRLKGYGSSPSLFSLSMSDDSFPGLRSAINKIMADSLGGAADSAST